MHLIETLYIFVPYKFMLMLNKIYKNWRESFKPSLYFIVFGLIMWFVSFGSAVFDTPGADGKKTTFFIGLGCILLSLILIGFELASSYKKELEQIKKEN